jgi:protocatechuate 3,4-dioxygenase beta subunit
MDRHNHDLGLAHDLKIIAKMTDRRRVLRWIAGASFVPAIGCGSDDAASPSTGTGAAGSSTTSGSMSTSTTGGGSSAGGSGTGGSGGTTGGSTMDGSMTDGGPTTCTTIPEETAGPYPGDGSNGANALVLSGIVRSDIRSSFGGATGTAAGVPLTVKIIILDQRGGCAKLSGFAVYIWHCDREGLYSMYTAADQNYLRGVQETDADGTVTFVTTFPGCYPGRWPHIHFEIFASLAEATVSGTKIATSQLALPADSCNEVYATAEYSASKTNLSQISLASDMVFSDGYADQVPVVTGSVVAGYVATLYVAVSR